MREAVRERRAGILTYGLTPPKLATAEEKRAEIATRQIARIAALPLDALVLYDIQDESARTSVERPFPYLQAVDPIDYAYEDLAPLSLPKIVYRSVATMDPERLEASLDKLEEEGGLSVFVGAASKTVVPKQRLGDAYESARARRPELPVGGVLIAERHEASSREDERVRRKVEQGASFFVTQTVYSSIATKNVLSDLHFEGERLGLPVPPILVTLSPCGSPKTLEFMRWLGISIPRWLENELCHSKDILRTSIEHSLAMFEELHAFSVVKGIPLGCNIESVSLKKEEIDASVEMVQRVAHILGRVSA